MINVDMPDAISCATPLSGLRICLATSGHPADDDRIFFKEARSLAKFGADVVVLCAHDAVPPARTDGVRFANYEGGGRLKDRALTIGKLADAIAEQRCDVVHCHEPDSLIAALRVKRKTGVKVIFDSHELWAGVLGERFPRTFRPLVRGAYRILERRWLSQCDVAIGASYGISEYLTEAISPDRVATILNVPAVDVFGEDEGHEWGDETILCHDGSLTFARGLKTMAEAVRLLAKEHRVILKIVGDVFGEEREWLDAFVARHHLEGIIVRTGWLPYGEVGKAISPCHIGLINFLPCPNHEIAAPNKCFNYLLYGLPVVGPRFPRSHFAILEKEGCAVLADPSSPADYAAALGSLLSDRARAGAMAATARRLSREKYRWEQMEPVLVSVYVGR